MMNDLFGKKFVSLTATLILVAACAIPPQIHYGQLTLLDKGLSSLETQKRLQQTPLSKNTVILPHRTFEFHRYLMNNSLNIANYFLVFENDQLAYWGKASELEQQPDQDLKTAFQTMLSSPRSQKQSSPPPSSSVVHSI